MLDEAAKQRLPRREGRVGGIADAKDPFAAPSAVKDPFTALGMPPGAARPAR
jgi:hypothetical protein